MAVFVSPEWFFLYSVVLEVLFAVITIIVSVYAFKVYKLTEQRQARLLGWGFIFIALSYIFEAVLNFLIYTRLDEDVYPLIKLQSVSLLNLLGVYAHSLLFIIGLLIIAYVTFKISSGRVFALLLSIVILTIFFSVNKVFLFYVLSCVILIFIVIHFFENYLNNKNVNTLIMLIAMIFLLFATFHFILATDQAMYYVIGHVLAFISFALILANLIIILQHGKKKR